MQNRNEEIKRQFKCVHCGYWAIMSIQHKSSQLYSSLLIPYALNSSFLSFPFRFSQSSLHVQNLSNNNSIALKVPFTCEEKYPLFVTWKIGKVIYLYLRYFFPKGKLIIHFLKYFCIVLSCLMILEQQQSLLVYFCNWVFCRFHFIVL